MRRPVILEPAASVVREVLPTVAELLQASERALRARMLPSASVEAMNATRHAEAYVRELTERVQSRARSAGMEENDLLAAAYDVIEGRRLLPAGDFGEPA